MDRKAFIAALSTLLFLISLLIGMQAVGTAKANPIPWCFNPQMTANIQSPVNGANCALPVLVSFTAQGDWQFSVSDNLTQAYLRSFFHVLDGQDMRTSGQRLAGTKTTEIYGDPVYKYNFSGQANLTDITDGLHSITVYYGAVNNASLIGSPSERVVYNPSWAATSQFYVDSKLTSTPTTEPTPSPILSPTPLPFPTRRPVLEVIDVITLRNFGGFYGAAYDSGTDEVYVANVDFDLVSVISASNRTEVAEVPVGKQPLGVAYDSGKGEIFVANYASNSVSVISDSNRTVVATVSVGSHPTALAYDWGKGEVFVVNRDDNTVSVISDSTNTVIATIPVGKTPYGIAYSATGKVYVTNYDDHTVSVISDSTNNVVATVQVGVNPYHAAYDSGRGEIFVTNHNSSSVSVISDSTNAVVANITVGSLPVGLVYDFGKGLVFVGSYGDNSVSVISDDTNTVVETITSQQQPFALAYDFAHGQIFVAHMESWSVSVISDHSDPFSSPTTTDTLAPSASPTPLAPELSRQMLQVTVVVLVVSVVVLALCAKWQFHRQGSGIRSFNIVARRRPQTSSFFLSSKEI